MPTSVSEGRITFFSKESGFTSYVGSAPHSENPPLLLCIGSQFFPRKGTRNQAELVGNDPPCYGVNLEMLLDNWEHDDALVQLGKRYLKDGRRVIVRLDPHDPATSLSARIALECMLLDSTIESSVERMRKDFAKERFRFAITEGDVPARLHDLIRIQRKKEEARAIWGGLLGGRSLKDAVQLSGIGIANGT